MRIWGLLQMQSAMDVAETAKLLRLLGDESRVRLLALLAQEPLTVAELVRVTRLAQSRVSTHLGRLREAGLVRDRPAGASTVYAFDDAHLPESARRLWEAIAKSAADPLLDQDRERLREALLRRAGGWADAVAGSMERHYSPGRTWEAALRGLLGLVELGDVLDVASGDGALAELCAPRARSVTCLDLSRRVVAAGARRLQHLGNVRFQLGDMHALPFRARSFDQLLLLNSLSYARQPEVAVAEAARVLRPGGLATATTLRRHRHRAAARQYDHVQLGFEPDKLRELFESSGFEVTSCALTSREKRAPHFEVITLHARRRESA
jgi:ArsR family transcriptional regulator